MVTINNKIEATNFLKISLNGSFTEKDIGKLLPLLQNAKDDTLKLMVVIEQLDITGSLKAINEKIKAELLLFKKISRCAFVTDKKWMKWITKVENFLLPTISIKTFDLAEQEEAKQWLLAE